MSKIGLVSCVKTKLDRPAKAKDLYVSDLFKKARAYCEEAYDEWYILSAKYGLLHPDDRIKPYEKTLLKMTKLARQDWGYRVFSQMKDRQIHLDTFYIHAGKAYCDPITRFIKHRLPLKGLGMGATLSWYKERLN
jgi:hypothetical protein